MRAAVAEIAGERGLRIAAPLGLDAGGGPAERAPPVGADGEPRRHRGARRSLTVTRLILDLDRLGVILDAA